MKEDKRTIAQKEEEMIQMEERLQRLEMINERPQRQRRHHHRYESRSSQNYQGYEEEAEWRRQPYEDRRQNVAKPFLPYVKFPSFSGEDDPNVYLGWKAKVEKIFNVHEVQKDQKEG